MEEEELDRRFTILESFSRYCDELRSKGSASEVCRSIDEILRRAEELQEDHEAFILCPRVSFDITFQATDFSNFFETMNVNIIGSLNENIEELEDVAVVIDEDFNTYMINLHRPYETVFSLQQFPNKFGLCPAISVSNNTVYITGVGEAYSEIWKYNLASGWNICGSLLQGREGQCAEFIGETLYIFGGLDDVGWPCSVTHSIEAYNSLTEESAKVGQLTFGSYFAGCVAYKGSIYVFGGLDKHENPIDCVQVYNPVENNCTLLSTPMPYPSLCIRALLWETYAILQLKDTCFIFDFENKNWQERSRFKTDEIFFGMVLKNDRIFTIGGEHIEIDDFGFMDWTFNDEVNYGRASSIIKNEAVKWKTYCQLPRPMRVVTTAKLALKY